MQENSLSPFHAEFLGLLQRDLEGRYSDAPVALQRMGLSPISSDEEIPLGEIIENYSHLFSPDGLVHIEKNLMKSLPIKDFIELGLYRYYPRVYRGLPRVYHRNYPSQSHIKKNFTHLPSLKKLAVNKVLLSLYSKAVVRGKVTLFTWILEDGLGDFTASTEVLRILRSRLPEVDVRFIGLVKGKFASHLLCPEGCLLIPYEEDHSLRILTEEAWALLQSSDLILQMPTYYPFTKELVSALASLCERAPKMELVGEYGFIESSWFHPKSGGYSLGLHFLEKGILIRKPIYATWKDVKNEYLQKWRCPENHFYLAYLSSPIGGAIYLHSLLKSLETDPTDIDLCVPDLNWFIQFVEKQNQSKRPVLEWELGIGTIEVYFQHQVYSLALGKEGKKLRILCPGSITQSDFRVLLSLSGDWVAVRGNQSFSEAVSQGKAFYYDGREHSRYFLKDLLALAANRIGAYPSALSCIRGMNQAFLHNLPPQEGDWVDEVFYQEIEEWTSIALNLGLALQDPDSRLGFQKLTQILAEEFSANPFFCHLVQRALCHRKDPELERLEGEELQRFAFESKPFAEWVASCSSLVKKSLAAG